MEQERPLFQIEVNQQTKEYFSDASKWGRTVAIIGFCALGLFILLFLFLGNQFQFAFGDIFGTGDGGSVLGLVIVMLLIVLGIVGVLCYFLYRGATRTRAGIINSDQSAFSEGIAYFRNYFLMIGILALLALLIDLFKLF